MKKSLLFLSLLLVLVLSACSTPLMAAVPSPVTNSADKGGPVVQQQAAQPGFQNPQPAPAPRSIAVVGTGQVTLAPEIAYINIGVQSMADNVAQALSDNNDKSQAVAQALKDNGVDEKDIQTSNFSIYPQQQYGPQGEIISTSYVVNNTIYVTVRDLSKLGQLLDVAVRSGANSINGISFDVTQATRDQAVADARRLAVDSARAQAQSLADASGVTLGELLTLSALQTNSPVPMYDRGGGYAADASSVPISAGQIVIHVDVNATYAMQ